MRHHSKDEHLVEARRVRREYRRHELGVALVWIGTLLLAFGIGHTQHARIVGAAALILVSTVMALLIGGGAMWSNNRHRRDRATLPKR